jgi:general secretion pathway protein H
MKMSSVGSREVRRTRDEGRRTKISRLELRTSNFEPYLGFTLLEVLVVLVLLAAITAVVAPSLGRGIAILELQSTARHIAAALRLARSKAVREQQVYFVGFDLEKGQVGLTSEDMKYQKTFDIPEKIKIKQILRLKTENLREDRAYSFFFAPNGLGESFEVWLANQRGRELKVVQDSLSRSPRIEEPENGGPQ